ncbi:MAG: hypothetical protein F6J96_08565 [Symploca sp. SIO1C2]|nr:hypothetical protein [Symploca sp. SIO1C2]
MVNIIEGRRQKAGGRRQKAGVRSQKAVIMKKIFSPPCMKIPFSASPRLPVPTSLSSQEEKILFE